MSRPPLPPGLYDAPLTRGLADAVAGVDAELRAELEALDPHEAPEALARAIHRRLVHALRAVRGSGSEKLENQLGLANAVLHTLREGSAESGALAEDELVPPGERLVAIVERATGRLGIPEAPPRPGVPLATSDLLVNSRHDLSLGPEVAKEIQSADRVDLLCSFLKWSGLRIVRDALTDLISRNPNGLRVLTTAYMGATERRALDALVEIGAKVRVSYDTRSTRLHAKAWLFHRDTGFSTGCVGSSNLSAAAMLDGLEWNVRLAAADNGPILDKFQATFEQYWEDPEFRAYDPATDGDDFDEAIRRERTGPADLALFLDIQPRPHQQEMLDDVAAERAHGHTRNLVVAATGTGKTIVAALDYKRLLREMGQASLLFVAHRKEILQQSLQAFRVALRDGSFGELHVGGETPRAGRHVFASIQSLHADRLATLTKEAYDIVIVDEFHHAKAPTYERLLEHLRPKILLGLTATPERADGKSVLEWFDGRIASELRLWKALDQNLLSPFQYFGVSGPDLTSVTWTRGRYLPSELSNVYTVDDLFVRRVIQEVHDKVSDPRTMTALGFCVDKAHAHFMAARFDRAGLSAKAVTADTPASERKAALSELRQRKLRVLFSVDLFNEGVDVPDVDTVLFLRPTESATLFLQQLGRGLRRSEGKECLTVLDFIGQANRSFRFDTRFRAIVGGTRRGVERQVKQDFPSLPAGCSIHLDRVAKEAVLDNIRSALGLGYRVLIEDLRHTGDIPLAQFLRQADVELEDIYDRSGSGRCFTALRRQAGFETRAAAPDDQQIERAFARMLHIDDRLRLDGLRHLLSGDAPPSPDPADPIQRFLFVLLGYMRRPLREMANAWQALWASPALLGEARQLLDLLDDRTRSITMPLPGPLAHIPLRTHATYSLDEVMCAVDERNRHGGIKRIQTGVYYIARLRTDLLFITLEKSAQHYSPTTLYNDYPLSERRFHWETQSNCHEATPTGRRYLQAQQGTDHRILLFVRQRRNDDRGETMPYLCLGPAHYRTHRSARPMQIEWDLAHPMPAGFYQEVKVAAG